MIGSFDKPILCPVIVGRASDLVAIHTLLERAKHGSRQVVLLSGEAGIGKSRLIAEVKTMAATLGFLHIQGNCFPTDLSCPYAPLLDLLHMLFATTPAVEIVERIEPYARELQPLLPENGQLLSTLAALPPLPSLEPEQEKRRLFTALAHVFSRKMAEQHPLLLIIEDLHWCDNLSLEFLHYLARHCANRPVLVLLTYRNDEVRPVLKSWLAQLDRERVAQEFSLTRLPRDGVDAMLRAICDLPSAQHKELLGSIYALTEGNPFFVEEALKSLIVSGDLSYNENVWESRPGSELRVPRSIQDTVQRRTALLSETAHQVLLLASVAGHRFDFTLLQELTGHDEHQLLLLIKEQIAAQLVVEESAERFAFRHALTRQAIYGELLLRERRQMHRRIAETLERLYVPFPGTYLADLSTHFYEAEMWEKALVYARQAGERAQALHAPEAAIQHFSRALESSYRLNTPPPPHLYRARGQVYETLGKFEQARDDYEKRKELACAAHDQRAEWQSLMDLGFLSGRARLRAGRRLLPASYAPGASD